MRICLFTPTFLPRTGGAERVVDTLARGFQARGHEPFVLAPAFRGPPVDLPYPVRRYRRPIRQHLWPELLVLPLWRAHRRWGFEVVLAFYSYPTGYAAGRLKRRLGFGVVATPHGGDLYPNYHGLRKPRVPSVIRAGYRNADRIVSISEYISGRLRDFVGEPLPPIDLVHNGIDLAAHDRAAESARRSPPDLPVKPPFLLHLCRVAPVKRVDLAVEAVRRLRPEFERLGVQYAIAGGGEARPRIEALVAQHDLASIIKVLGNRTGDEKAWLLDNAMFMVSTSREEGLPLVAIEAMASGLPMLASDIEPHRELIGDLGWGVLFENEDLDDLVARLGKMLVQPTDRLRAKALAARKGFDVGTMIDGYIEACRKAAPARRR